MTSVTPTLRTIKHRGRSLPRRVRMRALLAIDGFVAAGRTLPLPPRVRITVSRMVLRRPWPVEVPIDRLLLGAQNGQTATEFATHIGRMWWPSTPLRSGPHVALLRLAQRAHHPLSDDEIHRSPYGQLAQRCISRSGRFFWATDAAGVIEVARSFLARYQGAAAWQAPRRHQSGSRDPILAAPIRGSDHYQILDGHHRLAIAAARGETTVHVTAKWRPVTTPIQDLLTRMSWLDGKHELYQPLDAPELHQSWTLVRRCSDRLATMTAFLEERGLAHPRTSTYCDVASCYGWFVAEMRRLGYTARGVERDPLAVPLGQAAYGLEPGTIDTGDCVTLLREASQPWDIVSCFSLLHHFVLGRGSVSGQELLHLLDRVTGTVLFLDTGQEHETWFARSLRGWHPASIEQFLRRHTTFDEVVDLGPDSDNRPPYAGNYGRHLFACVRTSSP